MSRAVDSTLPGYHGAARACRRASRASRTATAPTRTRCRARRSDCSQPSPLGPVGLHDVGAVGREPDGEAVPPPELARDAPRPDRLHPVEEDLLAAASGWKRDAARAHGRDRRARRAPPSCRTTAATRSARRGRPSAGRSRPSGAAAPRRRSGPPRAAAPAPPRGPLRASSPSHVRLQVAQPSLLVHEQQRVEPVVAGRSRSRSDRGRASPSARRCRSRARRASSATIGTAPVDQRHDRRAPDQVAASAGRRGARRRRCRPGSSPAARSRSRSRRRPRRR